MTFWLVLTANSITFGGLLFLLSAGFSLIFGLMRIPNLTHGSLFMLGAYIGATFVIGMFGVKLNFWLAAVLATLTVAFLGALAERFLLRRLPGDQLAQVLVTLGLSFMAADFCLIVWGGDPLSVATPPELAGFARLGVLVFPNYRLAIIVIAAIVAIALWLLLERTRLGAMIRAGVDDPDMARVVGIRVSQLFTIVFALGAGLAAFAGIIGGPILSVYPGLDQDMLPLALVVVILGGTGSLLGSFVGSFYPTWDRAEFNRLLALLDVPLQRKAIDLSGGTRSKLALALALAHRPALLLLDEPTSGLDPVARREFLEILAHESKRLGQTALFSSHLVDEVQFVAQRVGILDQGRLLYQGPIDGLLERVRRITWHPDQHELPPGFRTLRADLDLAAPDAVLEGEPAAWAEHSAAFAGIQRLTLEDVFLAMVRKTAVPPA